MKHPLLLFFPVGHCSQLLLMGPSLKYFPAEHTLQVLHDPSICSFRSATLQPDSKLEPDADVQLLEYALPAQSEMHLPCSSHPRQPFSLVLAAQHLLFVSPFHPSIHEAGSLVT
jgi:hypothetical protein